MVRGRPVVGCAARGFYLLNNWLRDRIRERRSENQRCSRGSRSSNGNSQPPADFIRFLVPLTSYLDVGISSAETLRTVSEFSAGHRRTGAEDPPALSSAARNVPILSEKLLSSPSTEPFGSRRFVGRLSVNGSLGWADLVGPAFAIYLWNVGDPLDYIRGVPNPAVCRLTDIPDPRVEP